MDDLLKIKKFLKLEDFSTTTSEMPESVKELVVARFCKEIGINISYNYNAQPFRLFSNVVGEALCRMLNIGHTIAHPIVRLARYNYTNLIDFAYEILATKSLSEAFIDIYYMTEKVKNVVPKF